MDQSISDLYRDVLEYGDRLKQDGMIIRVIDMNGSVVCFHTLPPRD